LIGARAEEIALKWIKQNVPHCRSVTWVARDELISELAAKIANPEEWQF
jgi:hypothetical protein